MGFYYLLCQSNIEPAKQKNKKTRNKESLPWLLSFVLVL